MRKDLANSQSISDVLWQATQRDGDTSTLLVDDVYAAVWKQIVQGDRQQGEHLFDSEIAEELGVSRTPVRQALHQLQRIGLVQVGPGRGFHVTIFSADDIRELYDLRTVLEVAAVRAATPQLDAGRLQTELEQIEAMRAVREGDISARFLRSDIELHHDLIAVGSGNRRLVEVIANQRAQLGIFLIGGTRMQNWIDEALDDHERIVQAMLARDVASAATAMEHHIQVVKEKVLRQFVSPRRLSLRSLRANGDRRENRAESGKIGMID